ncbi:carbonate dehydratase [Niveibacterium sp. 24ML]|uniref:carbonate dehydratase n=1 Tax=Niveibacterium sp. 24ML TaxID=2985512 RepID=UPI002271B9B2|nr:carbonate dehydratase [Niveibacterium sp. 24ML]MCX9155663.1 carbonate dehydratase [Niveibacterium sp. 24ML]
MMKRLDQLLERNQEWARGMIATDAEYFSRLVAQQNPEYLWIGCSDSRVPANQIVNLAPGEVFVHRNVANLVVHTDLNCLSVLQYAVDVLRVKHILVVGHYGCGGVKASLADLRLGLVDNWLRHVQDVRDKHRAQLETIEDEKLKVDRLCELNVVEQVVNIAQTTVMKDAWQRGQQISVHGWCYGLQDGLVRDLDMSIGRERDLRDAYTAAVER